MTSPWYNGNDDTPDVSINSLDERARKLEKAIDPILRNKNGLYEGGFALIVEEGEKYTTITNLIAREDIAEFLRHYLCSDDMHEAIRSVMERRDHERKTPTSNES